MSPELSAFLDRDPEFVPLVRLFHLNFDDDEYYLNEGVTSMTVAGQVWKPCMGWIAADPVTISSNPFDANPAYYTMWNVDNLEGDVLSYMALNDPESWSSKKISQFWTVRGFPNDLQAVHVGRIMDVTPVEANGVRSIRVRTETIAAARNFTPLGEYTPRDQARRFPGLNDKGCDFAAGLVGKKLKGWLV